MSTYNKPYLSFEQQLDLLKKRGLEVTNDAAALEHLRRIGYYRLSGYWYPFRKFNSLKTDQYKQKYGLPLPIWVAIELWDFGLLSTFYKGMTISDKIEIAKKYHISDCQIMESWLRSLNYVRNVVAHHNRLWNRNLIDQPKLPKQGEIVEFDSFIGNTHVISRIYIVLCILAHFMRYVCPKSSWHIRLGDLIRSFPSTNVFSIKDMGFPDDWEQHVFWKI